MCPGAETCTITSQWAGSTNRITLAGEFDLATVAGARACFDDVLSTAANVIELDLRAVTFIDSAGVRLLSDMRLRAQQRLHVIPSPAVTRMVQVAADSVRRRRPAAAAASTLPGRRSVLGAPATSSW